MFAAFIFLPTRFWPRIDRELPFLAIALCFLSMGKNDGCGLRASHQFLEYGNHYSSRSSSSFITSQLVGRDDTIDSQKPGQLLAGMLSLPPSRWVRTPCWYILEYIISFDMSFQVHQIEYIRSTRQVPVRYIIQV